MKNDHVSIVGVGARVGAGPDARANASPSGVRAPRKLHKPLRDSVHLTPDQVVTYSDECGAIEIPVSG